VTAAPQEPQARNFHLKVMGRTLEHLGVQMYKRRDAAIAELVANSWDAGATRVEITVPDTATYSPDDATLLLIDDGSGMSSDEVERDYLVIGRNRRAMGQAEPTNRKVMGRKGIGKLAGFGLARRMEVASWREDILTVFELDAAALKTQPDTVSDVPIQGQVGPVTPDLGFPSGTRVVLRGLKHRTPLDPDMLRRALARRFSRTVRGHMQILVNGDPVEEPPLSLELREPPSTASDAAPTQDTTLPGGATVRWWAGFSSTVLPAELQGFTVLVRGKTAQAAPFFFGVESTATAQVGTKYLTGVIEADYLDEGQDDDSDRISTDRQEIDWSDDAAASLHAWGAALVRRLLRDRRTHREDVAERRLDENADLKPRIDKLDKPSRDQVRKFVRSLGGADADPERSQLLADTVVRAYEYRQFHDYTEELDKLSDQPEQLELALEHLRGWKVLESRAVLEVVRGRLDIVDKFNRLIVDDSPETAPRVGRENLHDLIADYPWLIQPEWQVMAEETRITSQLRDWGEEDLDPDDRDRYDFLALEGGGETVVIEIKRSGHAVVLEDLQQIEGYVARLARSRPQIRGALITGDSYAVPDRTLNAWREREDIELLTWAGVCERTRLYYEHYRAVLEGDVNDAFWASKTREVARTREVLASGAYRGSARRRAGLGPQDITLPDAPPSTSEPGPDGRE